MGVSCPSRSTGLRFYRTHGAWPSITASFTFVSAEQAFVELLCVGACVSTGIRLLITVSNRGDEA